MTLTRFGLGVTLAALFGLYAVLAVRWTGAGSAWATTLVRPAWQPPGVVFGVVWPLNFIAMAVVGTAVTVGATPREGVLWMVLFEKIN